MRIVPAYAAGLFSREATLSLIRSAPPRLSQANSRQRLQQRSEEKCAALQPERRGRIPGSFEAETLGKGTHHLCELHQRSDFFFRAAPPLSFHHCAITPPFSDLLRVPSDIRPGHPPSVVLWCFPQGQLSQSTIQVLRQPEIPSDLVS